MLKFLLATLFGVWLFGAQIHTIKDDTATIDPVDQPIGTSGIVIHHFDQEHATIIARAILIEPNRIRFTTFDALAQPNLPKPKLLPGPGDEVIIGYLNNRALIIAPNYQTYQAIANALPLQWLHPDLFAAELAKAKHPAPTKEDFHNFCNKFALSTLIIALENEAKVLDCYSFATLETLPLKSESNETKLPFYTRIQKISGSLFDFFGSSQITNYYTYYKTLTERK